MTHQEIYQGGGFSPQLPEGRSAGQINVSPTGVEFRCKGGGTFFPIEGLELKFGGNHLIFIRHRTHSQWTFYTADRNILNSAILKQNSEVARQLSRLKGSRRLIWGSLLVVLLLLALGIQQILSARSHLADFVADKIPLEWEQKAGETLLKPFMGNDTIQDPELLASLKRLVNPVLEGIDHPRFDPKFHLLKSDQVNAFALPGGQVVVLSQLILEATRPEEIMGVIAHELAHVMHQHSVKSLISSISVFVIISALLGDISPILETIIGRGAQLWTLKYSREFEREADELGWNYLVKGGVDPTGLIGFFKILKDKYAQDIPSFSFLSSHPATENRIRYLNQKADALTQKFDIITFDLKSFQNRLRDVSQ